MSNETLLNQFNNLVDQYKSVYKQYTDSLDDDNLIVISDYSYQGTSSLSQVDMNGSNDCLTNCQNTTNCSGATFNSQSNNCAMDSGIGKLSQSKSFDAITKKSLYYSYQLSDINNQLMSINTKILNKNDALFKDNQNSLKQIQSNDYHLKKERDTIKKMIKDNDYISNVNSSNHNSLVSTNDLLNDEKNQLNLLVSENRQIDRVQEASEINLTKNYYNYIIYLLLVILCIFLFIKFTISKVQTGGGIKYFYTESLFLFSIILISLCY
jgi:hypothetical protein